MRTYTLEMSFGVGVCVSVDAETKEAAIEEAKRVATENLENAYCDNINIECAEFEQVTFIEEK